MNTVPVSFLKMFTQEHNGGKTRIKSIEIPRIQRDYAQGRETKDIGRIRKQFLVVLYDALTEKSEPVKLDFIYGNITDGNLIPLDGQQRLTTLFLLHWYIAKHENINSEEYSLLNKFTYRTRFSSRDFCEKLVQYTPDFTKESISTWISDQNWFRYSWKDDPTIHSMLVVIDEIHRIFNDTSGLWEKLADPDNPDISFYFLPLEEMGLTDSLYIKMNSRGKPLTEFEHFKAEFEKIIKSVSESLYAEFVKKVDNNWVDMLWQYRGDDDLTDDEFMRYYRFVTEIICYQTNIEIVDNDFDLAEIVYGKGNEQAEENLKFLFTSFDCWTEIGNISDWFEKFFSRHTYQSGKVKLYSENINLFLQCCNDYGEMTSGGRNRKFTLNNSLLLFSILQYQLKKDKIPERDFIERIRVVRNLIWNSTFEIREKMMGVLLSEIQAVIVDRIIEIEPQGFNQSQKEEEAEKFNWRENYPDLIEDANQLEDHYLLQGSIRIIGFREPHLFSKRAKKFRILFNREINYSEISRALLTIGDYSQLASWRFLFGNNSDSTWKDLFNVSKMRKNFETTQSVLFQLLDSLDSDIRMTINTMVQEYLTNPGTPKNWRYYFVKYDGMRAGNSGVYYWKNDPERIKNNSYEIIMMNTSISLNGKHWDPFLFVLYIDSELSLHISLEEYGSPLVLTFQRKKITTKNNCWVLTEMDDETQKAEIAIDQENGIDKEDRIEKIKKIILQMVK